MRRGILILCLLAIGAVPAFRIAVPGYKWSFPADEGPHSGFANEWWYFTGNLRSTAGAAYGFELTFFRISPAPGLDATHDLYFTHFALTDVTHHSFHFDDRAHRGDWAQAGADTAGLWNGNWRAGFGPQGPRALTAAWGGDAIALQLGADPRMLEGPGGWSQKGDLPGQASYYYSYPRLPAQGALTSAGVVSTVQGDVWMDHEFASNQLGAHQQGWDWMGLQLDGYDLMLFNLRRTDGSRDPHSAATLRPIGGAPQPLDPADFTMTPLRWWSGYPIAWRVRIPSRKIDLDVEPILDDQLCHAPQTGVDYWEGSVRVTGSQAGQGYLELTGYPKRFDRFQ